MSALPRTETPATLPREHYALHHAVEILAVLERLWHERTPTTVELGDDRAIASSVLDVRRASKTLVFDIARDAELTRRLFAAGRLSFVASLDHIEIAFETGPASLIRLDDGPAAVVELPQAVVRLQRREAYRVTLPPDEKVRCTVLEPDGRSTPAHAVDLSCGGAGLVFDDRDVDLGEPGSGHELIFSLPKLGRFEIEATLSNIMAAPGETDDEPPRVRAGFRFVSVEPKTESQLQRYVNQVQVRRRGE